jgi:hypothetical protein
MAVPNRTYDIEGKMGSGKWMKDERLYCTRKEADAVLVCYRECNPSMKFRLVVVKKPRTPPGEKT